MLQYRRRVMNWKNRFCWCALMFCLVMATASAQQHRSYVADANREYAAIFSHSEDPCSATQNEAELDDCIGKEVTFTEAHLARLFIAIRGIASQDATVVPGTHRESEVSLLDKADSAWRQYRQNMCGLWAAGMAGGSGEGASADYCMYKMNRTYAQQLADAVYLKTLAE
jgi:uncharacterized protein YecT (DUF1311 family)